MLVDMGVTDLPNAVNGTLGMCGNQRNAYQNQKAAAYAIHQGAMITVAASEVGTFLESVENFIKFLTLGL